MQFANSIWLLAGVAACGILALSFYHFQKKSTAALQEFASGRLLEKLTQGVSPRKRMIKRVILVLAVAAIFTALARPQMGFQWKEIKRKGIDILVAVDTSKSMLAEDVKPNRLERSKYGIMDFVSKLEGDRVGLLPFAGTAFLMCPLTLDYNAFKNSLEALDTGIIPQGGTDLASAIYEAESAFQNDANHKILVLVTDGEDMEGEALSAATEAKNKGLTIYTVGVGTRSGELIPLLNVGKNGAFVKDETGQPVKSRLDETMLQKIAEATGGRYEPLGQQAEGLEAIYREKLSLVPKQDLAERMQKVPIERFQWPLMLALILLMAEFAISDRKRSGRNATVIKTAYRRIPKIGRATGAVSLAVLLLLTIALLGYRGAHASPGKAEAAYKAGNYDLAVEEYRSETKKAPEDPQLQFNLGTAAYKGKKYPEALKSFGESLNVQNLDLQNQSYYNMGNTLYRQGEGTEKQNPQETIKNWQASIQAYENALKLKPEDQDAAFNRDFVKKRLEALKKDQKQKDCNNKDQNKDKKKDDKQKNQQADKKDSKQNRNKDQKQNNGGQEKQSAQNQNRNPEKKNKQQNKSTKAEQHKNEPEKGNPKQANANKNKKDQIKSSQKPDQTQSARAPKHRRPGQMTEEQANNLLDSLKGDEKAMPMTAQNTGAGGKPRDQKRRDW
ncbi:MAG: VWA domain-containing protein [Deltaproteobacteria bacterium]|nr:VWA domain-containing protein [Deltaproteobacteria bacterium]